MYGKMMSDKVKQAPRMSLPLSKRERDFVLDLKNVLHKQDRTLKDFVWEAVLRQVKHEELLPLPDNPKKK